MAAIAHGEAPCAAPGAKLPSSMWGGEGDQKPRTLLEAITWMPKESLKLSVSRLQAVSKVQKSPSASDTVSSDSREGEGDGHVDRSRDTVVELGRLTDLDFLSTAVHIDGEPCWESWGLSASSEASLVACASVTSALGEAETAGLAARN
mmetsp:Transcript_64330/g.161950  ORF Transcript_64330/g.161950 Transcript_64330/m.161950 type:complete len:149 (+) Transcript_64330:117-563(+)|eukprot:CAMPEP_0115264214 /NCGR_PEP_ID=MMETSP0270-20121206/50314_1 /TAXON_ID=71861 /ORGANISM="Scrippsiella trochoidea, Strain CCMP3099" /LENGTH=148 /DNA_ID=CAMNT_0002680227 /DNA_START=36 /DNA_END=482 /DNA_ORIENTATION=+